MLEIVLKIILISKFKQLFSQKFMKLVFIFKCVIKVFYERFLKISENWTDIFIWLSVYACIIFSHTIKYLYYNFMYNFKMLTKNEITDDFTIFFWFSIWIKTTMYVIFSYFVDKTIVQK